MENYSLMNRNLKHIFCAILLFVSSLFTFAIKAQESEQEPIILRKFIYQVVESGGKKSDDEKINSMKQAFIENPQVLKWIIEARDINKIFKDADLPELPESIQAQMRNLTNLKQISLESYRKMLLMKDSMTQAASFKDLAIPVIANRLLGLNPELNTAMIMGLGKKALIALFILESEKHIKDKLSSISDQDFKKFLDQMPPEIFLKIANKVNSGIEQVKFSETPAIQMMKNPNTGFDLSQAPKKLQVLFNKVITGYFDKLAVEDKRNMVLGLLELPPKASDPRKLSSILNNSGPALQKLFQLFGKDVKSHLIAEVMNELKSNIKPFPSHMTQKIIEDSYGKKIDKMFSEFTYEPLAAASVGQVHLAKLKGSDREVIIKFLRPGILEKAKREIATLKSLAPDTGTKKIIEGLEESLLEELDFFIEEKNMEKGRIYDNPEKGVLAVRLVDEVPVTKNVMVMEKALGKTIDKYKGPDLDLKAQAITNFTEMWFDEAMFKGGFFHGDLHAGNIFFKDLTDAEDDELDEIHPDLGKKYLLTPIDFGSSSTLSPSEQRSILKFALGSFFESPKTIINSFELFHKMTKKKKKVFSKFVNETIKEVKDAKLTSMNAMNSILNKAIEMEFKIPKNFILFNRGRMFLEKHVEEINRQLVEDYKDYYDDAPQYDAFTIYRNVVLKRLTADIVKKVLGLYQKSEDEILDNQTISDLVDDYFLPKAKKYAKKAGRCALRGAYAFSYAYLEETMKILSFFGN